MKMITRLLITAVLLVTGNANASLISFSITGDVISAENYGGLAFGSTITADIVLDDTGLTGVGFEPILFTGSNTLNITAGILSFDQSMDSDANTSITFLDGKLYDLNFDAQYDLGAPEDFNSFFTSATASRFTEVEEGKGNNAVILRTDYILTAFWDNQTQFIPVATVPVPAAVWLFGSGLLGLAGFARRRKS